MEFNQFNGLLQKHVASMLDGGKKLFLVEIDKDVLWNVYLDSFPPGTNEIYRKRREFDCSCCRAFIKRFGNVVTITDGELKTIWDFRTGDPVFQPVIDAMSALVKRGLIADVFVVKDDKIGTMSSYEHCEDGTVQTWNHFHVCLPAQAVTRSNETESSLMAVYRDSKSVFQRSLDEISIEAIDTVLDMIAEGALYKGDEWKGVLIQFHALHSEYSALAINEKDLFAWAKSVEVGGSLTRIKNHSIGVLLLDITNGVDVDVAVRKYELIVAPINYKRPKAIFTKRMIDDAQKTILDLGLMDSLGRRHATLSDITINNILFANRNAVTRMTGGGVFEELQRDAVSSMKKPDRTDGVSIEDFINSILPSASSIEAWIDGGHEQNLVSLIAPQVKSSPSMFKWGNGFSWAYNGNITDSMKQRVKDAGGKVDGVLRFSIQWNTEGDNQNDYDAHCIEPNGNHIYFSSKGQVHYSTGILDVDIINPSIRQAAVENITWSNTGKMGDGEYIFYVHNYTHRGGTSGFSAEIEFDGQIHSFEYQRDLAHQDKVVVAKVKFGRKTGFQMVESLKSSLSTKTIWGMETNRFHPVSTVMFSPNYWDEQTGIGHKHYFFMLQGCQNDTSPNGFFNEFLREDFMRHKHVFEALGSKMRVEPTSDQLSGVGFSSTKRSNLLVKVKSVNGSTRVINLVF